MEEISYCIFCGSPLKDGDKFCPACKKEIPLKENLFKEYLYRNTKETLKEKVDDTLFNIVKNWLLSHLYGLVVSIVLIGLAGISLSSPQLPSYITEMRSPSSPAAQSDAPSSQSGSELLTKEDLTEISDVSHRFTQSVFYYAVTENGERDVHISGFENGAPLPETYYIPKTYDNYPISSYFFIDTSYRRIETDQGEWIRQNEPSTEIGKTLHADGFPVAEMEVSNIYFDNTDESAPAVRTDRFLFVLVKMDGAWYIAETMPVDQEG